MANTCATCLISIAVQSPATKCVDSAFESSDPPPFYTLALVRLMSLHGDLQPPPLCVNSKPLSTNPHLLFFSPHILLRLSFTPSHYALSHPTAVYYFFFFSPVRLRPSNPFCGTLSLHTQQICRSVILELSFTPRPFQNDRRFSRVYVSDGIEVTYRPSDIDNAVSKTHKAPVDDLRRINAAPFH